MPEIKRNPYSKALIFKPTIEEDIALKSKKELEEMTVNLTKQLEAVKEASNKLQDLVDKANKVKGDSEEAYKKEINDLLNK